MSGSIEEQHGAPRQLPGGELMGKGAVVTGAASGICKAIAAAFINTGARVIPHC